MSEQVIDIRDRIEKMRDQMTVPGSQKPVQSNKVQIDSANSKSVNYNNKNLLKGEKSNVVEEVTAKNKVETLKKSSFSSHNKSDLGEKVYEKNNKETQPNNKYETFNPQTQEQKINNPPKDNFKTYDDYQKDRVKDESKQSVKLDENQPFPKFSLNVSNPISWKLMLLIMLMQLLTNMMLVVVLYLK